MIDWDVSDGTPPERVVQLMESWGANGVGVNCDGPASVYNIATKMVAATHLPVIGIYTYAIER